MPREIFNGSEYVRLRAGINLHRSADGGAIIYRVPAGDPGLKLYGNYQVIETEGYLIDYLGRCDGTRRHGDIGGEFVNENGPLLGLALANKAFEAAAAQGIVEMADRPMRPREIIRTGSQRSFQPLHLTLEIIETCNFACDHCYYSSSPDKKGRLSLGEAIRIMDQAKASGVRVVEITGGECTIHPDFREILAHAAATFDAAAIISNGYRLGSTPGLAEYVGSFNNVMVQISIDGLARHHDVFRKHTRAFEMAEKAVKALVAKGIHVRVAMTVTDGNIEDILPMYELAKGWNVLQIAYSPVASIGRGCNISDAGAGSARLVQEINRRLAPVSDDPILGVKAQAPNVGKNKPPVNCGAGWRTFAVDYEGDVRACNYSRQSKKFGNMLTDDYESIFSQPANYLFNNAPAPGGEICADCDYYFNCKGCFVKAFMVSETEFPQCPWRAKWFPGMPLGLESDRKPVSSVSDALAALPQGDKRQATACSSCGSVHAPE